MANSTGNRRVAAYCEGSVPSPAALSNEVMKGDLAEGRMHRCIHKQFLILRLKESLGLAIALDQDVP